MVSHTATATGQEDCGQMSAAQRPEQSHADAAGPSLSPQRVDANASAAEQMNNGGCGNSTPPTRAK